MEGVLSDRLDGRVALVTGGSRGIGRATCFALAARGATVAVHYHRNRDLAHDVADAIEDAGGRSAVLGGDLGEAETPKLLVDAVVEEFGRLDILVNNAADMVRASVEAMTDDQWESTINLNLNAVFRITRAALPHMRREQWGRIIIVTSQSAYSGSANYAHYATTKAGLAGFTYSLAKELGSSGITVNMVAPGRIVTDLIAASVPTREAEWLKQTPMGRLGQAEEVAPAIVFLASEGARYITGSTIHVNGGLVMR